jgi:hypothetical protein
MKLASLALFVILLKKMSKKVKKDVDKWKILFYTK